MKRLIFLALVLTGCSGPKGPAVMDRAANPASVNEQRVEVISRQSLVTHAADDADVIVLRDSKTGAEYLVISHPRGLSVTPMLASGRTNEQTQQLVTAVLDLQARTEKLEAGRK